MIKFQTLTSHEPESLTDKLKRILETVLMIMVKLLP